MIRFGNTKSVRPPAVTIGRDRGSISGFVVMMTIAVLACAGLVVDGARIVGAKVEAADHAENAARAGAQEIVAREGTVILDVGRARMVATTYLSANGVTGVVSVTPGRITVTVLATVRTTLLNLVGVGAKSVSASRSSDPVTG